MLSMTNRSSPLQSSAGTSVNQASEAVLTVYYDGACPVCSREIAMYQQQDAGRRCAWVDVSRCAPQALGDDLTREQALKRFHVRHADGRLDSGAHGFAALWAQLPATSFLARVARWPGVLPVLELGYRAFLVLRRLWRRPRAAAPNPSHPTPGDPR